MNTFRLQVISGLCSRLRVVVGAIAYCEATNRRLIVDWPLTDRTERLGTFEARMGDLWRHPYEEYDGGGNNWSARDCTELDIKGDTKKRSCNIEDFLPWFTEPIGNYLNRMQPSEAVQREINTVYVPERSLFVGVNIRYDNKQPDAAEPEWFIERMKQFPPETQFFGSFDCRKVHDLMKDEFPGRIQTTPKNYVYDKAGIIRTCADLYILQKCDWVIGSNWSSYSQMAAFMRGAEYIGPHDKRNGLCGGRYEDAWNPPDETELERVLCSKS